MVKRLFKEPKEKSKPKFTFSDVAKQAAVKAQKRELRKPADDFRIASLFKSNKHDYKIEKLKNTNTTNLIHQDLSTRFLMMLTYFKCTMPSPS